MSDVDTLHVWTPVWTPLGGVVKLVDYAQHARSLGIRVHLWSKRRPTDAEPLFARERFRDLLNAPDVSLTVGRRLRVGPRDLAMISLPRNFEIAQRAMPRGSSPERIVHLVQGVRHANPTWGAGYPLRLLTRPVARISVNDIVAASIEPWLDPRALHRVVELGHDCAYFAHTRDDVRPGPLRVAYTTWKSDLGDRVAARLAAEPDVEFRAVRGVASWSELREVYQWSDVFLCTPSRQEGFYLPGLEAMAAGSLVVTPDAGGNMAYCAPEENCLLVGFEDVDAYAAAVRRLLRTAESGRRALRTAGHATATRFDLARERDGFARFLAELEPRIAAFEAQGSRR